MAGETLHFSTSALRSVTGATGPVGLQQRGTGGTFGPTGPDGAQGPVGPKGSTGIMLKRTEWDEETKRWSIIFAPFDESETSDVVRVSPRGLTGNSGFVIGTPPSFYNVGGNFAVVTAATSGTIVGPGTDPYWTLGISGSTLSFRKLGVSGDLVFYTDETKRIGTGPTYDMIGISGPVVANQYGTVTGQSVGELVYLTDRRNVKDAHGLTFNEDATITSAGFSAGGLTWGAIRPKFYSATNYYQVHGNAATGIEDPDYVINNNQGSVHVLYPPFTLKGITYDKHATKRPISVAAPWDAAASGVYGISGPTANYGEATTATLIIKNGPFGANFSDNFYFTNNSNQLGEGTSIINCLTYDEGVSWLCSVVGTNFGYTGTATVPQTKGACCNSDSSSANFGDCIEYSTLSECDALGDSYQYYEGQPCENTPCADVITEIGSCCVNKDTSGTGQATCLDQTQTTREECEFFGGTWRANVPCGPQFPCGDPCDEGFGDVGACCKYNELGQYLQCTDDLTFEECNDYGNNPGEEGHYSVFGGIDTFCASTNCCDYTEEFGACCVDENLCQQTTARECTILGGIYQGHNTDCSNVICACDPDDGPDGGVCFDPTEVGVCCFGCNPGGCAECACSTCISVGGNFLGSAYSCDSDPCGDEPPPPATGACCVGLSCSTQTPLDCAILGGIYQGDDSDCLTNPCEDDQGDGDDDGGTIEPPGFSGECQCCYDSDFYSVNFYWKTDCIMVPDTPEGHTQCHNLNGTLYCNCRCNDQTGLESCCPCGSPKCGYDELNGIQYGECPSGAHLLDENGTEIAFTCVGQDNEVTHGCCIRYNPEDEDTETPPGLGGRSGTFDEPYTTYCNSCNNDECSHLFSNDGAVFECEPLQTRTNLDCEPDDPFCNDNVNDCLGICVKKYGNGGSQT